MRTFMSFLVISTIAAANDDFTSQAAKEAAQKYEQSLKEARALYSTELEAAAKETDDVDELIRIRDTREGILEQKTSEEATDVARAREKVTGRTYSWNRPRRPDRITFMTQGRVKRSKGPMGVWQMIEPTIGIVKFSDSHFLVKFDDKYEQFQVKAFGPIKTEYTTGKRITGS